MRIEGSTLQDLVFLVVGIAIMAASLLWDRRHGARSVELNLEKLGISLKSDRTVLIFLLGFIMAGVGVFFRYRGYESRIQGLQDNLSQANSKMDVVASELQSFKDYDLGLNLVFPDDIDPRELKIEVYTKKLNDNVFKLMNVAAETDIGGTWVRINNLNRGEKIKIIAHANDGTTWQSGDIEIPKSQIQMVKRGPRQ